MSIDFCAFGGGVEAVSGYLFGLFNDGGLAIGDLHLHYDLHLPRPPLLRRCSLHQSHSADTMAGPPLSPRGSRCRSRDAGRPPSINARSVICLCQFQACCFCARTPSLFCFSTCIRTQSSSHGKINFMDSKRFRNFAVRFEMKI